jgi:hypothetical protein
MNWEGWGRRQLWSNFREGPRICLAGRAKNLFQLLTIQTSASRLKYYLGLFAEDTMGKKVLIPVPVPIYVPAPMHMYSSPYPVPVPFPLPVPVPIFVPTTRNSAHGIMKEIKVSVTFWCVCMWGWSTKTWVQPVSSVVIFNIPSLFVKVLSVFTVKRCQSTPKPPAM